MSSIEKLNEDLHNALKKAEQTRKRTGSGEDRDLVMLITCVTVSLGGQSPEKRESDIN
ncbi:unnamed protein product [marine sediment metagenome]|uniref:Uncharacterized protein n=1 Tax=marine sediment metagenome TaxID=412755 RepID=X1EY06_9ZZZZ